MQEEHNTIKSSNMDLQQQQDLNILTQQYNHKLSLSDNDQSYLHQFYHIVNNQAKDINLELYIVDDQYAHQIKLFQSLKFTIENDWQNIIKYFHSNHIIPKHYAAIGIKKMLAKQPPYVQQVIDAGLLPHLIQLAKQQQYQQLKLEALWSLSNLTSGTHQQTTLVVQHGVIPLIVQSLNNPNISIAENSIWAVGNLSSDNYKFRDTLINNGALQGLINLIETNKHMKKLAIQGMWALSNLCRGQPLPKYNMIKKAVHIICRYALLNQLQYEYQYQLILDCLWAVSYHPEAMNELTQNQNKKLTQKIVSYLLQSNTAYLVTSLRVLQNLFIKQYCCDMFLQNNGMDKFQICLNNDKRIVKQHTLQAFQQILNFSKYHIQDIFSSPNVFQRLLYLFEYSQSLTIKMEISKLFRKLSTIDDKQNVFQLFQQYQIVKFYILLLKEQNCTILDILTGLVDILLVGELFIQNNTNIFVSQLQTYGGYQLLLELSYNPKHEIAEKAKQMLNKFFSLKYNQQQVNNNYMNAAPN